MTNDKCDGVSSDGLSKIPCIYDVEHYKHFFLDHINLVIPKKRKKNSKKKNFRYHFKNFIVIKKVIRQQRSIDIKGILKQSESEEAPNKQEVMGPISIQVSIHFVRKNLVNRDVFINY